MKKYVSIAAIIAAVAVAPSAASAHSWKHHHGYQQDGAVYGHDAAGAGLVVIGAGAGAGALIAGPVGAAVGGVAGLFLVVTGASVL